MTIENLFKLIDSQGQLPTLPKVISRVLQLIRDPKTSASDIGKVISHDMALSTKILKIVNSAFYGFSKQISTVQQAVVIMGFNAIKSAVLGVSIINAIETPKTKKNSYFNRKDFWEYAVGCGSAARVIAKKYAPSLAEEAFVAGILHDIGKIILDQFLHKKFIEIMEKSSIEKITFTQASEEILGFSDSKVAAFLLKRWNFPENLRRAVQFHQMPLKVGREDKLLVSILHLSIILTKALDLGNNGENLINKVSSDAWVTLKAKNDDLEPLMKEILKEFENAKGFLLL